MPPPQQQQSNPYDLILQRLDQLHTEVVEIRAGLRDDLKEYVLKVLHDKDVQDLTRRDDEQQAHLNRLEERVLSQGQRFFLNICAAVGLLGGAFGLLHLLHILP